MDSKKILITDEPVDTHYPVRNVCTLESLLLLTKPHGMYRLKFKQGEPILYVHDNDDIIFIMPDLEETVYGYIGMNFTSAHFTEFHLGEVATLVALGNRRDCV